MATGQMPIPGGMPRNRFQKNQSCTMLDRLTFATQIVQE